MLLRSGGQVRLVKSHVISGKLFAEEIDKMRWRSPLLMAMSRDCLPIVWQMSKELKIPWNVLVDRNVLVAPRVGSTSQPVCVRDRTVILVSDGLPTHMSIQSAIKMLKRKGVYEVVVAVPEAPQFDHSREQSLSERVIVFQNPEPFYSEEKSYDVSVPMPLYPDLPD